MWIVAPPSVSPPFAPASAVPISPLSDSVAADLSRSCTSSGKSRLPRFWRREWKRAGYLRRLSGLTCEPSTLALGVERWISSWRDSPAPTSALPVAVPASTASTADSGSTCSGAFARWARESSSWRTCQPSLLEGSTSYSGDWPKSGSMRSGAASARPTLVRRTSGSASSSWPTATAMDSVGSRTMGYPEKGGGVKSYQTLTDAATHWNTPRARDGRGGGRRTRGGRDCLSSDAEMWATPVASESTNRTTREVPSVARGHGKHLSAQAAMFPTPSASTYGTNLGGAMGRQGKVRPSLETMASQGSLPGQETPKGGAESYPTGRASRQLNPRFVAWMMGVPVDWLDAPGAIGSPAPTCSVPSGTESFPGNSPRPSADSRDE